MVGVAAAAVDLGENILLYRKMMDENVKKWEREGNVMMRKRKFGRREHTNDHE